MSPEMINFFFDIVFKKRVFTLTKGYPPRPVSQNYEKKYFAMKTNGIRWCFSKRWWIFPLGLIFYVCSSARNWISYMYKGIYEIPFGE